MSCFNLFKSKSKINIVEKIEDGKTYEVMICAFYIQWLFFLRYKIYFDYNLTTLIRENILIHDVRKTIKRSCTLFLCNVVNKIRFECSREYEKCYRDLARSNDLKISFERTLLIHAILINFSLIDFSISLTFFRNLIHLFARFLPDILWFLIWIDNEIAIFIKRSSFLQKIKSICFNLFKSIIQIRSRLFQIARHRSRRYMI